MQSPTPAVLCLAAFAFGLVAQAIELPSNCGIAEQNAAAASSFRIVGGQLAKLGQFPWQVYLNKTMTYQGFEIVSDCGAALLSSEWIVTAAHCVYDVPDFPETGGIKVQLDAIMATVDVTTKAVTEIRRKVIRVIRHERFNYEQKANDIALLKIESPLDFSAGHHIQPVCVPKPDTKLTQNCRSVGFGYQDAALTVNDNKLRSVAETIIDHTKCNNQFIYYNQTFNLCIGGEKDKGTCKGDSGSPFVCQHPTDGRWYQAGVVSYGLPCALENVPDVLSNVAYYHQWIEMQHSP